MFCKLADLVTESDVEQKLVYPMLTTPEPSGLGFGSVDVRTKPNIKKLEIDKGKASKLYHPDYVILIAGVPLLVVEVKKPEEDCLDAYREARLYAAELNSYFPSGVNPCARVIVTNGKTLISGLWDDAAPDMSLEFSDIDVTSVKYDGLLKKCSRSELQVVADFIRSKVSPDTFYRAINLLGGQTLRDEEVGYNDFGSKLALDYGSVFTPENANEREYIVTHAYVTTKRREHYIDEIDKVIKNAAKAFSPSGRTIEDTETPTEILDVLSNGRTLEGKLMLLVGPRGSGKSTFVDYFKIVKLSPKLKAATTWVHLNLNKCPPERKLLENWVLRNFIQGLINAHPQIDFNTRQTMEGVFSVELDKLRKIALDGIDPNSEAYKIRVADELIALQKDLVGYAKAMGRWLCGERRKLLVVVFDNCDKRDRDEQLQCFEVAQWLQDDNTRCLVVLPMRDVTYDTYGNEPPLDTHIKDLVFRIEPPPFSRVLGKRIKLVLADLATKATTKKKLEFQLDNKITVTYPANELGMYLASIYKSLYEYDRMIRSLLLGLAGNDLRKAMEIFLEFCRSGHIGAKEIWKMKAEKGQYSLPYHVVTRVLLRRSRRFYDGDASFLANLYQCDPKDASPDTFLRLAILAWLEARSKVKGPTKAIGFFPNWNLIEDLVVWGHDVFCTQRELAYLVKHGCIITEHQRGEIRSPDDLIRISPSGFMHLQMSSEPTYLSACAEDSWVESRPLAETIRQRIGEFGPSAHFSPSTNLLNAKDFVKYLLERVSKEKFYCDDLVNTFNTDARDRVNEAAAKIERTYEKFMVQRKPDNLGDKFPVGCECLGTVNGIESYGVFVNVDGGPSGLIHISRLPESLTTSRFKKGMRVKVRVDNVDKDMRKLSLRFVSFETKQGE